MVVAPCDKGGILLHQVCNVVCDAWAVSIADSLAVPGEAHGCRAVIFHVWEQGDCSILDLVTKGLHPQGTHLVCAKQWFAELSIFYL